MYIHRRSNLNALLYCTLSLLIAISGLLSIFLAQLSPAIFLCSLSSFFIIAAGKNIAGTYLSLIVIFLFFSFLYGISGPFSVMFGEGLPSIFPKPYAPAEFLFHYALSIIGFNLGLIFFLLFGRYKQSYISKVKVSPKGLFFVAVTFAFMSVLMEAINFFRVGGVDTLFAGKAVYQSSISDLSFSLPSYYVLLLSAAIFSIYLSLIEKRKGTIKLILVWICIISPVLMSFILIGRRGPLLALVIIFAIGFSFYHPVSKIRFKWLFLLVAVYLFLALLNGVRGVVPQAIETRNLSLITDKFEEPGFLISKLNPSASEFGAAFGNFSTYINSDKQELRYGETYLSGLAIIIPRAIWADKPLPISHQFRNEFFSEEAERGRIAGTAYSSILEAYVNFGSIGPLLIYFFMAIFFVAIELVRARTKSFYFVVFYLLLVPFAISFHRSGFGMPFFLPLVMASMASVGYGTYVLFLGLSRQTQNKSVSDFNQ